MEKTTKKDILIDEYNKSLKKIIVLNIKIEVLKCWDKNEVIGKKPLTSVGGQVAYTDVTAGEELKNTTEERDLSQVRLNIINKMLTK